MFCPKCGKQIADGSKFCPKCGAAVPAKMPPNPFFNFTEDGPAWENATPQQKAILAINLIGLVVGFASVMLMVVSEEVSISNILYHGTRSIWSFTDDMESSGMLGQTLLNLPMYQIPFGVLEGLILWSHIHKRDGKVVPPVALTSGFLLDVGIFIFLIAKVRDAYMQLDSIVTITLTAMGWIHIMLLVIMALFVIAAFAVYISSEVKRHSKIT